MKKLPNIHPGEILREEFLKPLNLNINNQEIFIPKAISI